MVFESQHLDGIEAGLHPVKGLPDRLQLPEFGLAFSHAAISGGQKLAQFPSGKFGFARRFIGLQDAQKEFLHFAGEGAHAILPDGVRSVVAGLGRVGKEDVLRTS